MIFFSNASLEKEEDETSDGVAAHGFVNGRGPRPSGRGRDRTVGPYQAEVLSSSDAITKNIYEGTRKK